mmetsp:Transcript_159/g.177  ORF Transcript_159/g.177 Transcript_159/m.177 type:complete len:143 (+) Transcript_159:690-1118(+)
MKPYYNQSLNYLDIFSNFCSSLTILLSLFYLKNDNSIGQKSDKVLGAVFIFAVVINCLYLCYWIKALVTTLFRKAKKFVEARLNKSSIIERRELQEPKEDQFELRRSDLVIKGLATPREENDEKVAQQKNQIVEEEKEEEAL